MSDIDPATSAHHQVDLLRIEHAVREILDAIGEDPSREGLLETPARAVPRVCGAVLSGYVTIPATICA